MDRTEQDFLAGVPSVVKVWRGCYAHSPLGFAWTTERQIAERFPNVHLHDGYAHIGEPVLIEGRVGKHNILFVKLDRGESEVVVRPGSVEVLGEHPNLRAARLIQRAA